MRADLVGKYIAMLPDDFFLPNVMLTVYMSYFRDNTAFRAITFMPRQAGTNSINIRRIITIGIKAVVDFLGLRRKLKEAGK